MNKVVLVGRLARDPELRTTQSGTNVVSFTVACDRRFARQGEERQADFINCVAWNKTAEFISRYFTKGMRIAEVMMIRTVQNATLPKLLPKMLNLLRAKQNPAALLLRFPHLHLLPRHLLPISTDLCLWKKKICPFNLSRKEAFSHG